MIFEYAEIEEEKLYDENSKVTVEPFDPKDVDIISQPHGGLKRLPEIRFLQTECWIVNL